MSSAPEIESSTDNYDASKGQVTDWTDTVDYLGDEFVYIVGALDLWLGLQSIIMNMLVISFYYKSYKKIVPFMYLLIAACDSATGIGAIFMALIFFLLKLDHNAAFHLIPVAYAIYSVTFKVSVFLNLAISIVRTINIHLPFYRMRILEIAIATAVYTAGWAAYTIWQILGTNWSHNSSLLESYVYSPGQYQGVYKASLDKKEECRNIALFIGLPYLLPSFVVVFCMVAQVRAILKQRPDKTANTVTQRKITITIMMLTALFFICNTVYVFYPIYHCLEAFGHKEVSYKKEDVRKNSMLKHITGVLCPFINAALNPVILVMRGEALSGFLKKKLQRFGTSHNVTNTSVISLRKPNFRTKESRPASMVCVNEIPLSVHSVASSYNGPNTAL